MRIRSLVLSCFVAARGADDGRNAAPETVDYTIDGDLQTNTTMGNTIMQTERLRVTLGFESSSGPPG